VSLLGAPKLAGTDGLDVRKGEVLVVVQVVEDLVVRGAKGTVFGGFEGYVVNGERAHVIKSSADIADFTEVGVDSVLGVAIPGHKASDLTGKKDSLHVPVLERESSEKSFPYLLSAQKLVRGTGYEGLERVRRCGAGRLRGSETVQPVKLDGAGKSTGRQASSINPGCLYFTHSLLLHPCYK
jgi:hypothetical protein